MKTFNFFNVLGIEIMDKDIVKFSNHNGALEAIERVGNDWRLPTIGELKYLYNLHKLGIGNFSDGKYWSSSHVGVTGCEIIRMDNGYCGVGSRIENLAIINARLVRDII